MKKWKVMILGGYGNFGKRIVEGLYDLPDLQLIIAGRNIGKAQRLVSELEQQSVATLEPFALDIATDDLESLLREQGVDVVIHTAGPFQGQSYHVPRAAISAGAHYLDLSDDRRFVCDISELDSLARAKQVLAVSGASSVPGLSSAVIDRYQKEFEHIDKIEISIAPGNRAERGEATVKGILSYTGRPFEVFSTAGWRKVYGWMNPRRVDFGEQVGPRWLANVDVPDLELFPSHYGVRSEVRFQAGLELTMLHFAMFAMACLARIRLVRNWAPLSKPVLGLSKLFQNSGSPHGAMRVSICGEGKSSSKKELQWFLYAPDAVGPYIPTVSTVIIARKLLSGEIGRVGAMPCIGLYSLEDFEPYLAKLKLHTREERIG
jgi:saccharopine dehydrogenase-like NADP-dependent oxidoreductase